MNGALASKLKSSNNNDSLLFPKMRSRKRGGLFPVGSWDDASFVQNREQRGVSVLPKLWPPLYQTRAHVVSPDRQRYLCTT